MTLTCVALVTLAVFTATTDAADCDGQCCYSDNMDCDGSKHWCSKSASLCKECGGSFVCATDASKAVELAAPVSQAGPISLFSLFSGSQAQASSAATAATPDDATAAAMPPHVHASKQHQHHHVHVHASSPSRCCYSKSGDSDCDPVRDWCSKSAGRCEKCTGTFSNVTVLNLADTTLLAEEDSAPVASGQCCYAGQHDCDSGRDWCSKGQAHCKLCGGTFSGDGLKDTTLLAEEDSAPVASGQCCYTGHKDCDSGRDWCSKRESHCKLCGGTFNGDGLKDTTLLAEEGSAPVASGQCCYANDKDCDSGRDWCSKRESHCTLCGGTFHGDGGEEASPAQAASQLLAMPLQLAAAAAAQASSASPASPASPSLYAEQPEQPQQLADGSEHGKQGDWERYVPTQYKHFLKHAASKKNAEEGTEASQASAFLSGSTVAVPVPSVALLYVCGLSLALALAARVSRRSVTPPTEALG